MDILKSEPDGLQYTKDSVFDYMKNPPTQEQWLRGYWRWRKQKGDHSC